MAAEKFPVCTHCGFTWEEYRARGLLGCPHCYEGFGDALQADIAWLHQALAFAGPAEAGSPDGQPLPAPQEARKAAAAPPDPETLARWRERLAEAVRAENYEEAGRLKRLIDAGLPAGSGTGAPLRGQKAPSADGGLGLA
jgi:protein arginine kinase activator